VELITIKDIYKTYFLGEVDVPVLKRVTLEIGKGEMAALIGASGSCSSPKLHKRPVESAWSKQPFLASGDQRPSTLDPFP
jgi:ABC-type phosphate/phosphonate transport system ATPase subunit